MLVVQRERDTYVLQMCCCVRRCCVDQYCSCIIQGVFDMLRQSPGEAAMRDVCGGAVGHVVEAPTGYDDSWN